MVVGSFSCFIRNEYILYKIYKNTFIISTTKCVLKESKSDT